MTIEADFKFSGYGNAAKYGFREMAGDVVMRDVYPDKPCVSLKRMRCIAVAGTGEKQASTLESIPGKFYSKESWETAEDLCFHRDADGVRVLHHSPSDCRNGNLEVTEPTANGCTSHDEILILQHQNSSDKARNFAACLRRNLEDQAVNVKIWKKNELPPIKGVFQCAMVLQDSLFETMSHNQWTHSIRPKVQGSWNLHSLLPEDLDFFIMLSSFAALFGNRSPNYAAGGAYQDALAHYRRTLGRKGVSVDLGIMRDIGAIAEKGSTDYLRKWELPFGTPGDASTGRIMHGLLNRKLVQGAGVRTPFYFSDPRFSRLIGSGTEDPSAATPMKEAASLRDRLAHAKNSFEAGKLIQDALLAQVAKLFQVDVSEIDDGKPLHRYGVDSLVGMEIANWIFQETKVKVSMFDILASISIAEFAKRLAEKREVK
ncbi:MAG: hypothetical protein OHK93_002692 [Ramalina farinacea]|uniref:Carrier domain-containing protein n=1 Tax=Ramalina farinacea TaxID=258253 RepID=A0AA43QV64_9LECA|nr:hypothetical protein [Ramalina farinacea]